MEKDLTIDYLSQLNNCYKKHMQDYIQIDANNS